MHATKCLLPLRLTTAADFAINTDAASHQVLNQVGADLVKMIGIAAVRAQPPRTDSYLPPRD
eukprot:44265-Eustigmatos_ZCMA.PRE.1